MTEKIIEGDSKEVLGSLQKKSIDLVVTSPPYNIGKEYESDRKLTLEEYLKDIDFIAAMVVEVLSDRGALCWQVGNYVRNGEIFPLDFHFYEIFKRLGLVLRNRIIWHFNFGLHATNRLSGRYETLLWFTKSEEYTFNLDPIRVPQRYPGKRHSASRGDVAGQLSGNPKGKNPSDVWEFSAEKYFSEEVVWDIPNVKSNHPEKTIHPCQFPVELAERCILAFSKSGDTILDPFLGVGTTAIAALKHGRNIVGIDKDSRYIEIAKSRIAALENGSLRVRPSGVKPPLPARAGKVGKFPSEWSKCDEEAENGSPKEEE